MMAILVMLMDMTAKGKFYERHKTDFYGTNSGCISFLVLQHICQKTKTFRLPSFIIVNYIDGLDSLRAVKISRFVTLEIHPIFATRVYFPFWVLYLTNSKLAEIHCQYMQVATTSTLCAFNIHIYIYQIDLTMATKIDRVSFLNFNFQAIMNPLNSFSSSSSVS